jgi:hypothetical protein
MPPKTKKSADTFSENDIEILNIDIAGSFFMDMIGQQMPVFVELLQKIITPGSPELAEELTKLHVESITLEKKFDNAMVPKGSPKKDSDLAEVHWLFIVKNKDAKTKKESKLTVSDFTIYNAYEKNMQKKGSHQFCQSHALYMAYKYYSGMNIPITNPRDAYIDLLAFWKLLIDNIVLTPLNKSTFITKTLKSIFELNKEKEPNQKLVKYVIGHFPKSFPEIYKIMTSDFAKVYCPDWM